MSKPDRPERTPGPLSLELDADLEAGRRKVGRVERMVADAIDAAVDRGALDAELDAGASGLAVAMARAVDRGAHDPYAVAAAGRELAQLLAQLHLTPESRAEPAGAGGGDAVEDWLKRVSGPSTS